MVIERVAAEEKARREEEAAAKAEADLALLRDESKVSCHQKKLDSNSQPIV